MQPRGYRHLTLAVIDSVWSLQSHYSTVENVLEDYAADVPELENRDHWWLMSDESAPDGEHDLHALLARCGDLAGEHLSAALSGGRSNRSPGTTVLKADTTVAAAKALVDGAGVEKRHDLVDGARNAERWGAIGRTWRSVPGLGPASWRYVLNLSGVEYVKPETMITGFINRAVRASDGHEVDAKEAAELLTEAVGELRRRCPRLSDSITVRGIDHLAWRWQRQQ